MPAEVTPERLAEIEKREAAATEGPWRAHDDGCHQVWHPDFPVAYCDTREDGTGWSREDMAANAVFVGAARQDVPDMAAALRAAWDERDALRAAVAACRAYVRHPGGRTWNDAWLDASHALDRLDGQQAMADARRGAADV